MFSNYYIATYIMLINFFVNLIKVHSDYDLLNFLVLVWDQSFHMQRWAQPQDYQFLGMLE